MKTNELRIGNLVHHDSFNADMKVIGAYELYDKKTIWLIHIRGSLEAGHNPESISPIPLTLEWLERFGFYRHGPLGWRTKEQGFLLSDDQLRPELGFWVSTNVNSIDVKYVHQLQNLYFALTGEELELK